MCTVYDEPAWCLILKTKGRARSRFDFCLCDDAESLNTSVESTQRTTLLQPVSR